MRSSEGVSKSSKSSKDQKAEIKLFGLFIGKANRVNESQSDLEQSN